MLLSLLAEAGPHTGTYPGGASAADPVPEQISYYLNDFGYGIVAFVALCALLFAVTRLNADR